MGLRKPYYAALLVEAHLHRGDFESALAQIEESLARVHDIGDHYWRPEILRVKGELLSPFRQTIETLRRAFQEALDCARERNCRLLELRAALSLGLLWATNGEPKEPMDCSRRSTLSSPRASIPPTSRTPISS